MHELAKDLGNIVIDHEEILSILPHRYPFLLVDRVVHLDLENDYIVGQKNVSLGDQVFLGHFPGTPIMPGVLIVEALAQTGGILTNKKGYESTISVFLKADNVKFRKAVLPGDILHMHVFCTHVSSKGARIKGQAMVKDKLAAEAELSFAFVKKEQIR